MVPAIYLVWALVIGLIVGWWDGHRTTNRIWKRTIDEHLNRLAQMQKTAPDAFWMDPKGAIEKALKDAEHSHPVN